MGDLWRWLGNWIPTNAVHFQYEVGGRTYTKAMFHFNDETVVRDDAGNAVVICDPERPRAISYVIMKREPDLDGL